MLYADDIVGICFILSTINIRYIVFWYNIGRRNLGVLNHVVLSSGNQFETYFP